ncbi:hypothetical protein ACHAWX_000969 [Stephanocyclus meneghinianus]
MKPATCTSKLYMGPPIDPSAPITEQMGEGRRKYCRTVCSHAEWVKHCSSDRFVNSIKTLFNSGIYKQVSREVYATTVGVQHGSLLNRPYVQVIGLPLTAFILVSPSLGLLLVFYTNNFYKRWDKAQKFWGLNINHTRSLCYMATAWYGNQSDLDSVDLMGAETGKLGLVNPVKRAQDLQEISLMTRAFVRSMKHHLSPPDEDEANFQAELRARLSPEQAEAIIKANQHPNRALYDLSVAIKNLSMHFLRKDAINENLSIFEDTLGGSERLLSSPIPLVYSRHTARFLSLWLLLLPLALYEPFKDSWNHIAMIPATAFISVCLFGIEEVATQTEEPFTILPMQGFCDKIGGWCDEIVSWAGQGQDEYYDDSGSVPKEYAMWN